MHDPVSCRNVRPEHSRMVLFLQYTISTCRWRSATFISAYLTGVDRHCTAEFRCASIPERYATPSAEYPTVNNHQSRQQTDHLQNSRRRSAGGRLGNYLHPPPGGTYELAVGACPRCVVNRRGATTPIGDGSHT